MMVESAATFVREATLLFGGRRRLALLLPVAALVLRSGWLDVTNPADATLLELFFPLAGLAMAISLHNLDQHGMDEVLLASSPFSRSVWIRRVALLSLWLLVSAALLAPSPDLLLELGPSLLLAGLLLWISRLINLRAGVSAALAWWGTSYMAMALGDPVLYYGPLSWVMLDLVQTGLTPAEIWLRKGAQLTLGLLLALGWAWRSSRTVYR